MHIVYISTENPYGRNNGGIGSYCGYIVKMIAQTDHRVSFLSIGNWGDKTDCKELVLSKNAHVYLIKYSETTGSFSEEWMDLFWRKAEEIHSRDPIDVIECQDWLGIGYKIVQNMRVPFVTRLHTPLFVVEKISNNQRIYRLSEKIKQYEKAQMQKSTALSSPCMDMARIVNKETGLSSTIIPNPIDVEDFSIEYDFHRPELVGNRKYFLYLGRLEYRKGVLVLAEAFNEIRKKYPEYVLVMCGKDTIYKKQSIKKMIKTICPNSDDCLFFVDHVDGEEKKAYIHNAELIIQPSLWENFSYVTLETMALAKSVLATKSGGFVELIENGESGFLAEPDNVQSLRDMFSIALKSNRETVGRKARERVERYYNIKVMKDVFVDFYKDVINRFWSEKKCETDGPNGDFHCH